MRKRSTASFLLITVLANAGAATAQSTELYRINLSPTSKVGEKFRYEASESESSRTIFFTPLTEQSVGALFESTARVDSIATVRSCDQRGVPAAVDFEVIALDLRGGVDGQMLPSGTVVSARSVATENRPQKFADSFTLKDSPLEPIQSEALARVITIGSAEEPTEQQAFGTDRPLRLHGRWSLNGQPGANLLRKMRVKANPASVTGTARLVGEFMMGQTACLEVQISVRCSDYTQPMPPGQAIVKGRVAAWASYYIAKDSGRIVASEYESYMELQITGKKGDEPYIRQETFDVKRNLRMSPVSDQATGSQK